MGALWMLVPGLIDTSTPISGLTVIGLLFIVWGTVDLINDLCFADVEEDRRQAEENGGHNE